MQSTVLTAQRERIVWVDVLRFIAIFMVICIHCADPFNVSPEARSNPDYNFWGGLYGSMLRACVPLFVMITGVLLLPVGESSGVFYKKRLMRIAVPFLIWSVLYNLFPWITGVLGFDASVISNVFAYAQPDASQSFTDTVGRLLYIPLQFNVYTVPMWYLYMLIGLYLFMPILSAWIEKATVKELRTYLVLWGITLFLPYGKQFFSAELWGLCAWNGFDTFYYFAGFNGYLLLGYFLNKHVKEWSLAKTLYLCVPLFALGYWITYTGFKSMTANPQCSEAEMELFFLYCTPNVAMMTLSVFLLVRKVRIGSERVIRAFSNITKCGLGIYLVHYFVVGFGYALADWMNIPISIRIPITASICFLISWAFVAGMYRLLPKASKWIMG